MTFNDRMKQGLVVFDGAIGTQIQALALSDADWGGKIGCNEILNLTAPAKIQHIHEHYLAAGADVVETNSFGANEIVLAEYDLADQVIAINRQAARIAHQAVKNFRSQKPRFIAGSMGPGTRLISLGQTSFDALHHSYSQQVQGLIEGGVDLLMIETCQDLLQIKIAILAAQDKMAEVRVNLPIIVSVTVETTGGLLIGSEVGAVLAALEPFELAALGLNCATGPEHMRPYIKQMSQQFRGPIICQPNAGLPQNIDGEMVYTLGIEEFVRVLVSFVTEEGVQMVGGCCGTTPDYIAALSAALTNVTAKDRLPSYQPSVASLFSAQTLEQNPGPFFVGERTNTNGSKQFRDYLLANDWDGVVSVAQEQQRTGAHGLDLCVAYTGRNEMTDMQTAVSRIARQVNLPLFIDSTEVAVIEAALQRYGGRAVINSINLEEGDKKASRICQLAKRYGAAVIALTIDERGMALEVEKKVAIARRIYDLAVNRHGLRPQDLIFDALTFTLGSGDQSLKDAGINTLAGIQALKAELPGVYTILGVSNVSFGLNPQAREILNSVFLAEAVKNGLDLAIVNVKKIIPLYQIDAPDREQCLNLIYNRGDNSLFEFIRHFEQKAGIVRKSEAVDADLPLTEKIKQRIIQGNRVGLENLLHSRLKEQKALDIINALLIPAMRTVGDLFGAGEMQLPFVLQSAEVMKFAVDTLQPFMEKTDAQSQASIVLATVRGDVHDIGKNLVDIILSNNGYRVYNLGIKCEIDTMLEKAQEIGADAIGMSGLLVKSTVVMKENLEVMRQRHIRIPVLLGGAALTRSYVEQICAPIPEAPVVYCADAFEGLATMALIKEGRLVKTTDGLIQTGEDQSQMPASIQSVSEQIHFNAGIPHPPFWGRRVVSEIDLDTVFSYLNEAVVVRGRWGYRRGKLTREEYDTLLDNIVRPELEQLKRRCKEEQLLVPKVVYGYFPCNSTGDQVIVFDPKTDQEWLRFNFPRQEKPPYRNIADFFQPESSGQRDLIALQVVTVGQQASDESRRLFAQNSYKNYLLFHGLSVEAAEALAEYWHQIIRQELNITEQDGQTIADFVVQKYRGSRYSFGYPACPDLEENRKIFTLLQPEQIGVTLTENDQMEPEQTTSAFIVHHPQAKYFTIK